MKKKINKKMNLIYWIFVISLEFRLSDAQVLKCTTEFCDDYVQKFPCPPLDPACSNPNISLVVPSPTICNCCEHCFLFKEIGEDCIVSHLGKPLPNVICRPGTQCVNGICRKMEEPDPDFYPGYECEKEICRCAILENKKPKLIFGTFKKTENITMEKQCGCSASFYLARQSMNRILPFPDLYVPAGRCLSNGQYDPLQCIDSMCGCVNRATGVWDLSIRKVPIGALGPNNPKCFDPMRHRIGSYYTKCERERNNIMADKFWGDQENFKILFTHRTECTPDGEYAKPEFNEN